jgi:hypothetical protein
VIGLTPKNGCNGVRDLLEHLCKKFIKINVLKWKKNRFLIEKPLWALISRMLAFFLFMIKILLLLMLLMLLLFLIIHDHQQLDGDCSREDTKGGLLSFSFSCGHFEALDERLMMLPYLHNKANSLIFRFSQKLQASCPGTLIVTSCHW